MEWISVEDRLSEIGTDVIAYCVSDGISRDGFANTYMQGEKYMSIDQIVKWRDRTPSFRADRFFGKCTHWMPLPDAPKE